MASSSRDLDDVPATILVQYARLRPTWARLSSPTMSTASACRSDVARPSASSRPASSCLPRRDRPGIGRALTLLDEIQAPLDVPTRYALYEEVLTLAAEIMEGKRPQRRFLISSHMVSELEKVAEDVIVLKKSELLAHESVDDSPPASPPSTGHASDVERFLAAHPDLAVIASRELGPTREIVVDLRGGTIDEATLASHSLTSSPCSFQDAFAYLIQENDQ